MIRQPRVISEVIGGIVLDPSVMGRIPGFKNAIFPDASIPNLNNVAILGLILYLFIIGLETDVRFLVGNWRVATSVAVAGLALPFGVGCALAYGVYHAFRDEEGLKPIDFSIHMLFIGIAFAITVSQARLAVQKASAHETNHQSIGFPDFVPYFDRTEAS